MAIDKSPKEVKALMEATGMKPDKHNWIYSFMFINNQIYLAGYDKQCDQTFTVLAPVNSDGSVRYNRAGVAKYGCDWNGE